MIRKTYTIVRKLLSDVAELIVYAFLRVSDNGRILGYMEWMRKNHLLTKTQYQSLKDVIWELDTGKKFSELENN